MWICLVSPDIWVSGWVVLVGEAEEDEAAEALCPIRAWEYSMVRCRVGARRGGILVYVRNIAIRQMKRGLS